MHNVLEGGGTLEQNPLLVCRCVRRQEEEHFDVIASATLLRQSARREGAPSMLKVVGDGAAEDRVDGRSLLDEIAREGARRMLVAALEAEVAAYLEAHRGERDEDGYALVVRNGKGRTRKVTIGSGTIPVSAP